VTVESAWESWIIMLEGIWATSEWSTAKIRAIGNLLDHTAERLQPR
jgi:hypothetical protein